MKVLALVMLLLAGCAQPAKPPEVIVVVVPAPDCPGCKAPARPTKVQASASSLARTYRGLESAIAPAITSPAATVDYIRAVKRADARARDALRVLASQGPKPTPDALTDTSKALDELRAVLWQIGDTHSEVAR